MFNSTIIAALQEAGVTLSKPKREPAPFDRSQERPDFVVEVVSPTDRYSEIATRVARYLNDGVRLVWVMDADSEPPSVVVHMPGSDQPRRFTGNDVLSGGDVIPDFEIKVNDLF